MPSIGSLCVGSFYLFIFLSYNCSPEKLLFPELKSLLLPQFSMYRHQTWFIVKTKQVHITYYLGLPINCKNKTYKFLILFFCDFFFIFSKTFKSIHFFFQKEIIGHTYICTKCNDNFKFTISLKSCEE